MSDYEHVFNPEDEFWVLYNKLNHIKRIVKWNQIVEAFGNEQAHKMLNGFHDYWDVYKHYN